MQRRQFLATLAVTPALPLLGCGDGTQVDVPPGYYPGLDDDPLLDAAEDSADSARSDGTESADAGDETDAGEASDGSEGADAGETEDAGDTDDIDVTEPVPTVILYDVYAIALYFDGTEGPKTGIIRAEDVGRGEPIPFDFWHGHGGVLHRFTVSSENCAALRHGQRVTVQTTTVQGHEHLLFIDPTDVRYRVPGALPIEVPLVPPSMDDDTSDAGP